MRRLPERLLDDLSEIVTDHEIGCLCDLCEAWRMLIDPEYLACSSN